MNLDDVKAQAQKRLDEYKQELKRREKEQETAKVIQLSPATTPQQPAGRRQVTLTPASQIPMRATKWLWQDRLPLGSLCLVAGREGIGKSTLVYQMAADVTRGKMPGKFRDHPKAVIVAATEDSWKHTIAPRLYAAGADMNRVYRVNVRTADDMPGSLTLPEDIARLESASKTVGAAMMILDPLVSRMDISIDTHKDSDVRRGLEPLVTLAESAELVIVGLIHVNKSSSTDALNLIMASRAFTAVSRAVLFVMRDPDEAGLRLLGQPKNNLGRDWNDEPSLGFTIEQYVIPVKDDDDIVTSRIVWIDGPSRNLNDALEDPKDGGRSAVDEATDWLLWYLEQQGGSASSRDIKNTGKAAGHSESAIKRAGKELERQKKMEVERKKTSPPRTDWMLTNT